jgi:hypothetical protein
MKGKETMLCIHFYLHSNNITRQTRFEEENNLSPEIVFTKWKKLNSLILQSTSQILMLDTQKVEPFTFIDSCIYAHPKRV